MTNLNQTTLLLPSLKQWLNSSGIHFYISLLAMFDFDICGPGVEKWKVNTMHGRQWLRQLRDNEIMFREKWFYNILRLLLSDPAAIAAATKTTTITTYFWKRLILFVVFVQKDWDLFLRYRISCEQWESWILKLGKFRRICSLPRMFAPIWHTRKMDLTFQLTPKETVYMQGIELVVPEICFCSHCRKCITDKCQRPLFKGGCKTVTNCRHRAE